MMAKPIDTSHHIDSVMAIDIIISCPSWRTIANIEGLCKTTIQAVLQTEQPAACEISLLLSDDTCLTALNQRYRGRSEPTNVLSFPAADGQHHDGLPCLGDIALAWETIVREAADQGKKIENHLRHLIVHAVLHLLGQDHQNNAQAEKMEQTERTILYSLGVGDPYQERYGQPISATGAGKYHNGNHDHE